ncbi:hypothetical protein ART_1082 [Arthrobacter sp. PAMC 25486]|uniref:single-stranded DNA-binding protein n=1 Tax=Arthrobacter sp. PAMC 25486 TaxID=1494608 RepID=UPI0005361178|nr:single-stranded DNA-binding protein [Arthrobacter sp. PAMC 25486]AIY00681.1 hypothetical protein ART_1082 [Arthrobacter sp. PAMC 25486]
MANQITLRGFLSSSVESHTLDNGLIVGNFRMGSAIRKLDSITNQWVDGPTSWFRVNMFRSLATNTMLSIGKGDRVLVIGKLKVVSFLRKDGTPGTGVEIDADSIGPDLQFGTATYHRGGGLRTVGQDNSQNDAGASYGGGLSLVGAEGRPAAGSEPADPEGEDDDDMADDGQTAARESSVSEDSSEGTEDNGGLEEGEHADSQTGEITSVGSPF